MILLQISRIVNPITAKLDNWFDASIRFVPNIIIALLILIFFKYLADYVSKIVSRILGRASHNIALVGLISTITKIAIMMTGVFFALGTLGLEKTVASLVAGAGVLALAIGFAFQDLTANFISGAFIAIQRPIKVGDVIETNGYTGRVKSIGLRSVKLDNFAGQQVELPSKDIFQKPIVNFTYSGERRVLLECGVSYHDDLTLVEELATSVIKDFDFLSAIRPVEFNYTKFGDSSIDFQILFWIDQVKIGPGTAKSVAIKAIKKAFDENKISIPYPTRTMEYVPPAKE
ncbi:mechanosensitive ion channel family protein [Dyadobacter sp. NIV53]|uniref:mechanosensitive ion channel family protein n=1 Tax=Dyadobacter sp. NIV53 TaxID=2861765 RepID=UPI001C879181|nr:mechanosensitive ion channel family protein [Dyadobacter sp. NIV53]